uniref:Uncharacterized protein n=1 Tax=Triticum urartu TaxID=4572 RepID=A0A8R7R5A5_TRIUA
HIKNFKICQTTIITCQVSISRVFKAHTQSLFRTYQRANEIGPKQYCISLLQSLQYITTQICLLQPTTTTHNMLLFADMLHSFGHGFALHTCGCGRPGNRMRSRYSSGGGSCGGRNECRIEEGPHVAVAAA